MSTQLFNLLISEVSGVQKTATGIDGWMVMKSHSGVRKSGRVISADNMKLLGAALDALKALYEAAMGEGQPELAAKAIECYGLAAGGHVVKLAAQGEPMAASFLRCVLDNDEQFVRVLRKARGISVSMPSGGGALPVASRVEKIRARLVRA